MRKREIGGKAQDRWVDNIKMDLVEMGWGGMDWMVTGGVLL
jgi:hypothetical protein